MRERRVVQRTRILVDVDRLGLHLQHQSIGDRKEARPAPSLRTTHRPSRSMSIDVPVKVITGCSASGTAPDPLRRLEDADAVAAARVHDDLPGAPGVDSGEALDQPGQLVIGNGDEHEVSGGAHLGRRHHRGTGQQRLSTRA